MGSTASNDNLWSVILAGGEGERTRVFIEQWLGYHLPKQYCAFVGRRSMLQHTWHRADRLTLPHRKITVVARKHRDFALAQTESPMAGQLIFQPENCDTAAGVFLPLTYVKAWNPRATVILYPSDHFMFPEHRLSEVVQKAVLAVQSWPRRLMILGVDPTHHEEEYGWIERGGVIGRIQGTEVRGVRKFIEKPAGKTLVELRWAMEAGRVVWNTMVIVGQLETLWDMGRQCFPDLMRRFDTLQVAIGSPQEGRVLDLIYQDMPRKNFSSDLLQRIPEQLGVIELKDVLWSDWGNPRRIVRTLQEIGQEASFAHLACPTDESSKVRNHQLLEV